MHTLLTISLALATLSLMLTVATHFSVARVRKKTRTSGATPGISILKPLKGIDDGLYENLASLARQDYPDFELVIGCEDASDPALAVVQRLRRDLPHVKIRICTGAPRRGLNPKVNQLWWLSERASHDLLLISDASVRARPGYLAAMVSELSDPSVGLVSSVLRGAGEQNLGARLDNLHMNSFVVRGVCGAATLMGHACVVGKSMLFRRSHLNELGGFAVVNDVLAEDYVLGRRFAEAGFRVALSSHALESITSRRTLREFCERHLRWSQMRRRLQPLLYFAEPLHSPVPWLLAALALAPAGAAPGLAGVIAAAALAGLSLRLASDALVVRALGGSPLGVKDYAAILLKDVLCIGIWAVGAVKRTVSWRGVALRIGSGSRLSAPESEPIEASCPRALTRT
jgi:ceramide glucosyltransferase